MGGLPRRAIMLSVTARSEGTMSRGRALKILSLMLVCCIAASSSATEPKNSNTLPPPEAKQQVLDLGKEWVAAEIKHDETTLRRILDDKFVASFGAKKPYGKEAFIKEIVSGEVDPTGSQTLTDETVIIDQDTAVVVGTDTVRGTDNGAAYMVVYRYTVTYVRRHGQWLALAEHLVQVPQAK